MADDPIQALEHLLRSRFGLGLDDIYVSKELPPHELEVAVKTFSVHQRSGESLSAEDSRLLESAGFSERPDAYPEAVSDVLAHTARLFITAYSEEEVSAGLAIPVPAVRDRRLARTLWALDDEGQWVYPVPQFRPGSQLELIRGLEVVLPALPPDAHPTAVAGFLETPQPNLWIDGARTVQEWLIGGGEIEPVLLLIDSAEWHTS